MSMSFSYYISFNAFLTFRKKKKKQPKIPVGSIKIRIYHMFCNIYWV